MIEYVLGIDIGTTSVKVALISSEGKIVDEAGAPHDLISLHPNWAEEDANLWWENTKKAITVIAARNPEKMRSLRGIGCSGMVPAIVLLDDRGRPLRNSIQQNDARAVSQMNKITDALDQELLFARTGGRTNQQHILPRVLWVQENEPEIWSRAHTIMGSYDYIAYRLTGVKSIEINWAAESGAFDIHTRAWIAGDLERFGIPLSMLPHVNASSEIIGYTGDVVNGLPAGIPVIAGSADHVASTLAAGIVEQGDLLIKFGGAGDILFCADDIAPSPRLFFDYHIVPGKYLINGCMAASGSLVKWYTKDILGYDDAAILKSLDSDAEKIAPASDGLIILPYFLGEKTPLFDPYARGVFFGLTLSHTRAHVFRAILEAVIYGFRHHVEVIESMGYKPLRIMATNGGAKSAFWCQIAADVLGQTIRSYPSHPGSALGVAFLAGMSTGVFSDWKEIRTFLKEERIFEPNRDAGAIYDKAYSIYRGLYAQLEPSFADVWKLYATQQEQEAET